MRVITGTARGRRLKELQGMDTRPTTDKVKESMFSILQFDIVGRRVRDLFAGTCQLGIEALSRGAAEAVCVDKRADAVKLVRDNLELCGLLDRAQVRSGDSLAYLRSGEKFDLIFLDLMMPKIDGLQACMRIREFSAVPIIMLTARSEDADKIIGLESGADDYVTKPFNILELKARIRALLRRAGQTAQKRAELLTAGGIALDTERRIALRDGVPVDLTAKEYDILELLIKNPHRVYSRENLMDLVWGFTYAGDYRTVDVHIRRLREKLEGASEQWNLKTVWGVGYKFEVKE